MRCWGSAPADHPVESRTSLDRGWSMFWVTVLWLLATASALAQPSPAEQRGLTFVRANCAKCHAIDRASESPLPIAPPFRTLQEKYPVDDLRRPLSEGIIAGHPTMPQ